MINIALLGYGTVGSGFYEILKNNKNKLENIVKEKIKLKHILIQDLTKKRENLADKSILTDDFNKILMDPEVDIVVELIGGEQAAYQYIKKSLVKNKIVITANKLLIAKHYNQLMTLAEHNDTHIYFEASVAGGIPIIKAIRDHLAGDNIQEIDAILNGTTNYILSVMEEKTISMKETIQEAQELGYAEQDPEEDLGGYDVLYKICILANLAFDISVNPEDIPCKGIKGITSYDLIYASELGYKIKLIASIKNINNKINIGVRPNLVEKGEYLASIDGVFNGIEVFSQYSQKLSFDGMGAGKYPSANAVISDLIEAAKTIKENKTKLELNPLEKTPTFDLHAYLEQSFYIRIQIEKDDQTINQIKEIFAEKDLAELFFKDNKTETPLLPVIIITKKIKEDKLEKIIEKIESLKGVLTINNIIPIKDTVS